MRRADKVQPGWVCASAFLAVFLSACVTPPATPPAGPALDWSELPGWSEEKPAEAWSTLTLNCQRMAKRDTRWRSVCADAELFPNPDADTARAFFETRFEPVSLRGETGTSDGLITGYYEPLLHGALDKSARFRYPLYGRPDDLVVIDLGDLYPELRDKRLRGQLAGKRVVPYPSRAEIGANGRLKAPVLAWVDDPVALFFLQVQGSGRVLLGDGRMLRVGYADQNGHPYQAIGKRLIERGALTYEELSLQSIRTWLAAHPDEAEAVLNGNPSYVFFETRDSALPGPLGTLNVPLVAERAVAIDPAHVALGSLLYLDTRLPAVASGPFNGNGSDADGEAANAPSLARGPRLDPIGEPYQRLVFAHDTGGAIKGAVRADVFFGFGPRAELLAGHMKQRGRLYLLKPRARLVQ
jgi:membrane-bound lytic murein transglycosylase A